jgi:Na+-driven multidrug efflux pump
MAVLYSIREIITMPVHGLARAAIPIISFNYGATAFDRVKQAIRFTALWGIVYTVLAWLVIFCFPSVFIGIFTKDAALVTAGIPALHIYFFGFSFMSLHLVGQNVFLALGKAKYSTFFSLFRKVIIVVPLTLILPKLWGLGVDGAFWAEPVSNVTSGVLCFSAMLYVVRSELKYPKSHTASHQL